MTRLDLIIFLELKDKQNDEVCFMLKHYEIILKSQKIQRMYKKISEKAIVLAINTCKINIQLINLYITNALCKKFKVFYKSIINNTKPCKKEMSQNCMTVGWKKMWLWPLLSLCSSTLRSTFVSRQSTVSVVQRRAHNSTVGTEKSYQNKHHMYTICT